MFKLSNGQLTKIGIFSTAILCLSIICTLCALMLSDQDTLYFIGTSFAIIGSLLIMLALYELSYRDHNKAASKYILTAVPLNLTAFAVAIVFKYVIASSTNYTLLLLSVYFLSFIFYLVYFFGRSSKTRPASNARLRKFAVASFSLSLILFGYVILSVANITYLTSMSLVIVGTIFLTTGTVFNSMSSVVIKAPKIQSRRRKRR